MMVGIFEPDDITAGHVITLVGLLPSKNMPLKSNGLLGAYRFYVSLLICFYIPRTYEENS